MSMSLRSCCVFAVAGCLLLALPSMAAAQGVSRNLVDVKWLEQHLKDPDILILDASLAQLYTVQHIPGAVNVDAFVYGGRELPVGET